MNGILLSNAFSLGTNIATVYQLYGIVFTNPSAFDSGFQKVLTELVEETKYLLHYFDISTNVLNYITEASSYAILLTALPQILQECKYPIKTNFGENGLYSFELGLAAATYPKLRTSSDAKSILNLVKTIRSDAEILGIPSEIVDEFLERPTETLPKLKASIRLLTGEKMTITNNFQSAVIGQLTTGPNSPIHNNEPGSFDVNIQYPQSDDLKHKIEELARKIPTLNTLTDHQKSVVTTSLGKVTEELSKSPDNQEVVKQYWEKVVAVLKDVATVASLVQAISKLLGILP